VRRYNHFSSLSLIDNLIEDIRNLVNPVLSDNFLPLFWKILAGGVEKIKPETLNVVYGILWVCTCALWVKKLDPKVIHSNINSRKIKSTLFLILLSSPQAWYLSVSLNKGVPLVFLCVLSASLIDDKKYSFGVLALLMATMLRPYAPALVVCYLIALVFRERVSIAISILSCMFAFMLSRGSFLVLGKISIVSGYMFGSPNPLQQENWKMVSSDIAGSHKPTLILTLEGIVLGVSFIIGLLLFRYLKNNSKATLLLSAIVTGAATFTFVDYWYFTFSWRYTSRQYELMDTAANLLRLKFSLWPIIITWFVMVFFQLIGFFRISAKSKFQARR
jgi:hypothetical protein